MINKKLLGGAIVGTAIVVAGVLFLNQNTDAVQTETVKEFTVKQSDIVIDFISDGILVMNDYELSFKTSGVVETVDVELGEVVNPGDVIATLNTSELELRRKQIEIDMKALNEKIALTTKDYTYDKAVQTAAISSLEKDIAYEKETLMIMENNPSIYSVMEIKEQKDELYNLEEKLVLETLKLNNVVVNSSYLDSLSIEDLQITMALMDLDIAAATLTSPIKGVVVKIGGSPQTSVGTTTTFSIVQDQDHPYIVSMVSELDIHQVYVGQKIYAEFESDFGMPYPGTVTNISPVPNIDNNGIVTYQVEMTLESYPESTKAGLTTLLRFIIKEKNDVLAIPNAAVKIVDSQQIVEVKTETGSENRVIVTGLTDGVNVEVIDGLTAGDVILIKSSK
jgi:macrolide-specific efflux system membrane fusion protein